MAGRAGRGALRGLPGEGARAVRAAALAFALAACGTAGSSTSTMGLPGSALQARPARQPPACAACHVGQTEVKPDLVAICWGCHPGVHGGRAAAEEKGLGVECLRCHEPHKGHR